MTNYKQILKVIFLLIFSTNLFAGNIIKVKSVTTYSGEEIVSFETIYVQDGMIRVESDNVDEQSITIINPNKGIIINIDLTDSSYIKITEKDFKKFTKMIELQKEKMLKQLPEEQREAMSKMIEQQMEQMKNQPKTEYTKIKEGSFNGYDCDVYEGIEMDEKIEETWITPWKNMSLKKEYVNTFKNIQKFFQKVASNLGEYSEMMENEFDFEMLDKGFPVKTIEFEDGIPITIETLDKVEQKELSSELFKVPKGMNKKKFMEM